MKHQQHEELMLQSLHHGLGAQPFSVLETLCQARCEELERGRTTIGPEALADLSRPTRSQGARDV